jgi:drug/metabolite transporter (DMT)-like permease
VHGSEKITSGSGSRADAASVRAETHCSRINPDALARSRAAPSSAVTFFYAIGYPIGALAVAAMTPMAALVLRFGLAASILAAWTVLAKAPWPRGARFGHVAVAGLLIQGVQFCCLYEALQLGSPAVLCAVAIAMTPVTTVILGAVFLRERLGPQRMGAVALGVVAVLAACAKRLSSTPASTR